jgi:hypothetical protein
MINRQCITAVVVAFTLLLAGCTTIEKVPAVYIAAGADTVTTSIALEHYSGRELNPLGFAGATAGKLVYLVYIRENITAEEQVRFDRVATGIWTMAAVNNIVQITVPAVGLWSLVMGVLAGLNVYHHTQQHSVSPATE